MKVDSSNYADWVRKLRIVLIAAQKAYVLNAPLSVLNPNVVCTRFDNYVIVQLNGLELRHQRHF